MLVDTHLVTSQSSRLSTRVHAGLRASKTRRVSLDACVKFSRGFAEAGAGDVVVDVLVDGAQGLPEGRGAWGWWAASRGPEQPVVQLGVEDSHLDAFGAQDVAVGVPDPADQPGEPEPPQVIGHLAGAVGAASSPVIKARALAGDAGCGQLGGAQGVD